MENTPAIVLVRHINTPHVSIANSLSQMGAEIVLVESIFAAVTVAQRRDVEFVVCRLPADVREKLAASRLDELGVVTLFLADVVLP